MIINPEFQIPFTFTPTGCMEVEQGTDSDLQQNVYVILSYIVGERFDMPDFGVPSQVFRKGGADLDQIIEAISEWEPRANEVIDRDPNWLSTLVDTITVRRAPDGG